MKLAAKLRQLFSTRRVRVAYKCPNCGAIRPGPNVNRKVCLGNVEEAATCPHEMEKVRVQVSGVKS